MACDRGRRMHAAGTSGDELALHTPWLFTGVALLLLAITTWSYFPIMSHLYYEWQQRDDYSAGQLVPLVAVFLIWRQRKAIRQCILTPCWWPGLALVVLSQVMRVYGLLFMVFPAMHYSLILIPAGLVLTVAGWQVFHRLLGVFFFLFLMVPLPDVVHNQIGPPLQRMATTGSVFLLEAFGNQVEQRGNVVMLGDSIPMAVAEACSGLRMLTAFVIVAAFVAYMVKRPRWQKGVLLASSIPVAVICNMIRISLTAVIMLYVSVELGEKFFHDFAGLVMMPAAVSLIFGEIWLMDRLVVPDSDGRAGTEGGLSRHPGHGGVVVRGRVSTE